LRTRALSIAARCASGNSSAVKDFAARPSLASASVSAVRSVIRLNRVADKRRSFGSFRGLGGLQCDVMSLVGVRRLALPFHVVEIVHERLIEIFVAAEFAHRNPPCASRRTVAASTDINYGSGKIWLREYRRGGSNGLPIKHFPPQGKCVGALRSSPADDV